MKKLNAATKAARTVLAMAVIIFLAKLAGLFREILVANLYGSGYESDILNTATQLPLLFFDMTLGIAILSTFVPVFNRLLENDGKKRAMEFASVFITVVAFVALIASLIGIIFSKQIALITVPGFEEAKLIKTAYLLKILFPAIIFTAIAYIVVGVLQSFGEFNVPALISLVSNLVMILYLIIFKNRFGLEGVTVSMVIAWAMQLLIQLPALKKKGFYYRFNLNLKDEGLKEAAFLAVPVLVSSWVQPLCAVINMSFGSGLGDGAVSGLNWANKIYIIVVGIFAYAVTNFIFPKLSRLGAKDEAGGYAKTARESLGWIIFIIAFVASLFIALSEPVVKLIFEGGSFGAEDTTLTSAALFYYSFGMVGYAVCEVLSKSFYALRDGKTPMQASIFGIAVNFAAAFVSAKVLKMGVGGLALANSISSATIAAILMTMINKRKKDVITLHFVINMLKTGIAATASCLTAMAVKRIAGNLLEGGKLVTLAGLFISAVLALIAYIISGIVLRIDEIMFLCDKCVTKRKGISGNG